MAHVYAMSCVHQCSFEQSHNCDLYTFHLCVFACVCSMSAAYQALEWGVVVGASEAFVKVDFGGSQRDTMTRVEMDTVIARTVAVCTFLDAKGVPGACMLTLLPLHCPSRAFQRHHANYQSN